MRNEEIIKGLKLLEENLTEFDEITDDGVNYIDIHEVIFNAIEQIGECEYKDGKLLKKRSGEYVTYRCDYLLEHLAREIYLLEWGRQNKEERK